MLKHKILVAIALLFLLTIPRDVWGDEDGPVYLRMRNPTELCLPDRVQCTELPPGRFIQEDLWVELDNEFKRLQDKETRLTAENKSLRESATDVPWLALTIAASVGILTGVYIGTKL